jgi:hypothetical protein
MSQQFVPFSHEDLELKNALVGNARELRSSEGIGAQLSSALIYASITEYLAENLLANLRFLVYRSSYVNFAGIVFIDERKKSPKQTLGESKNNLEKYSFPDKPDIMAILSEINKSRNNLFHNLAKTKESELEKIDADIKCIQDSTEEFIEKVNVLYAGLQKLILPEASQEPSSDKEGKDNGTA